MGWTDGLGKYHTDDEPQPGGLSDPNSQLPAQMLPASQIIPGNVTAQLQQQAAGVAAVERPAPLPMPPPTPALPLEVSVSPAMGGAGKMETTGSSTTVARGELSKDSKQIVEDRKRLTQDAVEVEGRASVVGAQQADARAAAAADLYKVEEDFGAAQQKIIADSQKRIQDKRIEVDKAVEERKKAKFTDFFSKERGNQFQIGIAAALGGIGAAFSARGGGSSENKAMTTLFQLAERDTKDQERKIAQLDANIAMARTGVRDEEEAKTSMLADIHINKAAAMGKSARLLERNLAQTGRAEAEIASDSRVVAFKAAENQYLQQAYAITNKQIQSTTTKQIKDAQGQAATAYLEKAQGLIKDDLEYKSFGETLKKSRGYQELGSALEQAVKERNPTAINGVIRLVAQQMNGGVLSDNEGKQIIEQAGGTVERIGNKWEITKSGNPSAPTIRKFQGTINNLGAQAAKQAAQSRESIMQRYGQEIPAAALNILVPAIPGQQTQAAGGEVNAAVSWLQANPNHPRAGAVAEKLRSQGVRI